MEKLYSYEDLIEIIRVLRGENGCPWDKVQTHESLREAMLEEAYEAVDAINKGNKENLKEELGDVLMQIVFHGEIAREKGDFTLEDVYDGISKKMISRHSHIFEKDVAKTEEDVLKLWEKNKKKEKGFTTLYEELESVPKALPALTRAYKILKKSKLAGFEENENIVDLFDKFTSQIRSLLLENNLCEDKKMRIFGDWLFFITKISLFLGINPEISLTNSSELFINRLRYIETATLTMGSVVDETSKDDTDKFQG